MSLRPLHQGQDRTAKYTERYEHMMLPDNGLDLVHHIQCYLFSSCLGSQADVLITFCRSFNWRCQKIVPGTFWKSLPQSHDPSTQNTPLFSLFTGSEWKRDQQVFNTLWLRVSSGYTDFVGFWNHTITCLPEGKVEYSGKVGAAISLLIHLQPFGGEVQFIFNPASGC